MNCNAWLLHSIAPRYENDIIAYIFCGELSTAGFEVNTAE